jgi:hypothetical protein
LVVLEKEKEELNSLLVTALEEKQKVAVVLQEEFNAKQKVHINNTHINVNSIISLFHKNSLCWICCRSGINFIFSVGV